MKNGMKEKGTHEMTGGIKQWIRIGPSHSISGGFDTELSDGDRHHITNKQ
jgi:hypothetical protein